MLFIFHKSYVNTTPNFTRIFLAVRRNQVLGTMAPSQEGVALLMSKIWEPWEEGRGRGRRWEKTDLQTQLCLRLEVHLRQEVSNEKGQETKG